MLWINNGLMKTLKSWSYHNTCLYSKLFKVLHCIISAQKKKNHQIHHVNCLDHAVIIYYHVGAPTWQLNPWMKLFIDQVPQQKKTPSNEQIIIALQFYKKNNKNTILVFRFKKSVIDLYLQMLQTLECHSHWLWNTFQHNLQYKHY